MQKHIGSAILIIVEVEITIVTQLIKISTITSKYNSTNAFRFGNDFQYLIFFVS